MRDLQIVQFRGQTGRYLEPAAGEPSLNLLKMAREGLLYGLRSALNEARKSDGPVRKDGLRVRSNGGWREVDLEVMPLDRPREATLPRPVRPWPAERAGEDGRRRPGRAREAPPEPAVRSRSSQQELQRNREYLQSIIQELEAANEELQSANEEILVGNEELQSTNEELDTAKEELQCTNEELNTVNEELQGRNEELSRVNSDLLNLLASVQIAIVIVASDLRIRRFTPMAERVLNLIPADVGRPIGHIKPNIDCPDLEELILDVIETVAPQRARGARSAGPLVLAAASDPYKNLENRIDGAVLALFDVDATRRHGDDVRGPVCGYRRVGSTSPSSSSISGLRVTRRQRSLRARVRHLARRSPRALPVRLRRRTVVRHLPPPSARGRASRRGSGDATSLLERGVSDGRQTSDPGDARTASRPTSSGRRSSCSPCDRVDDGCGR